MLVVVLLVVVPQVLHHHRLFYQALVFFIQCLCVGSAILVRRFDQVDVFEIARELTRTEAQVPSLQAIVVDDINLGLYQILKKVEHTNIEVVKQFLFVLEPLDNLSSGVVAEQVIPSNVDGVNFEVDPDVTALAALWHKFNVRKALLVQSEIARLTTGVQCCWNGCS